MAKKTTVGGYLIRRLADHGVGHVFGVPGDYVLGFYDMLVASDLEVVGTCTKAGAYAEKSPVVVICDIGDSLFGAADLTIQRHTEFLSPAYYTSMGFAIPAALGVHKGKPKLRPLVFVGDGAFQMTGQELSTIARHGLNPIIFVLNNKGYSTERFINDGPYNDIHDWAFDQWPSLLRTGWGCEVRTEGELEEALKAAHANKNSFSIINVHLDPYDRSTAMERLGKRIGARIGGGAGGPQDTPPPRK